MFAGADGALGHLPPDSPTLDSSEQFCISSLALLKILKHNEIPEIHSSYRTILGLSSLRSDYRSWGFAETFYIYWHGKIGVPMEVMGLILGELANEYTVWLVDVFIMPQSGLGVSVKAIDHVFQTNMLDILK